MNKKFKLVVSNAGEVTSKWALRTLEEYKSKKFYLWSNLTVGFPNDTSAKEPTCQGRRPGSIPGLVRAHRGGHGNPLQCSCLDNPMDRGAWRPSVHRVSKSQTRLKHTGTQFNSIKILKCIPRTLLLRINSTKILLHVQKTSMFLVTL